MNTKNWTSSCAGYGEDYLALITNPLKKYGKNGRGGGSSYQCIAHNLLVIFLLKHPT